MNDGVNASYYSVAFFYYLLLVGCIFVLVAAPSKQTKYIVLLIFLAPKRCLLM